MIDYVLLILNKIVAGVKSLPNFSIPVNIAGTEAITFSPFYLIVLLILLDLLWEFIDAIT